MMKIHKLGHCCLLIEISSVRILTDPGLFSQGHEAVHKLDAILITHEHPDHIHLETLKLIIKNNPSVKIYTNQGVAKMLDAERISYELVEHGKHVNIKSVAVEGMGQHHATIYETLPLISNTGYFIADSLFYPGDALYDPHRPVEVLALPVAGPWLTLAQAIDYALLVKPKKAFPVHDGILKTPGPAHRLPADVLPKHGIEFVVIEDGKDALM